MVFLSGLRDGYHQGVESIPDRVGTTVGYRTWRIIPDKWIPASRSLYPRSCDRAWSSTGPTVAYCPPRAPRIGSVEGKRVPESYPDHAPPGFGCVCGLYARYEPLFEAPLLPYVTGSVLAWGRMVHHAERSFFRAEKALPVAFVRPGGGRGLFTREAEEKLFSVAEQLGAEMLENEGELREYTREEAYRW